VKACPRLRLELESDHEGVTVTATLAEDFRIHEDGGSWTMDRGTWVGAIDANTRTPGEFGGEPSGDLHVKLIEVEPSIQRCGIGTQLYEKVAHWTRRKKVRLLSDTHRSTDSESFWQKQVRKGRAECVGEEEKRAWEERTGKVATGDAPRGHLHVPNGGVTIDHWPCRRFALKPEARSLRGAKKPKPKGAQGCDVSYADFRAGWTFKDVAEMLGARGGAEHRPSRKRVLFWMGKLKREAFEEYKRGCAAATEQWDGGELDSADFQDG